MRKHYDFSNGVVGKYAGQVGSVPGKEEYSGKFLQRVPPALHKRLNEMAAREGVSLNLFVNSILAEALGRHEGRMEVLAAMLHAALCRAEVTPQKPKAEKKKRKG